MKNKILTLEKAKKIASALKTKNKKIILCHGVFDLLHIGHIDYLAESKSVADTLIVSITEDKYVNKGPNRPIFNQNLRAEILSAFECVDYIILSNEETAVKVINILKPNFYVKGNDYKDLRKDLTKNIPIGIAKIIPSILSNIPPCPGSISLVSLTFALRFKNEINKSPS